MVYGAIDDSGRSGGVIETLNCLSGNELRAGVSQPGILRGHADVIIVGAGVAGAALAYTLAKDGRRVHVIERDLSEQDRIVGELLQPGGYLKLVELGLADCVEKIDSQRVYGYVLFLDDKIAKLSYPLHKSTSDATGRGFHNGRFVQRLREKAASHPNVKLQQGTVTSLVEENGTIKGVQYKTKADDRAITAYAPLTVVCDGCFSNLRRTICTPKIEVPSYFVGIVLEDCQLPFANHGHVILTDPSQVILYPIGSTEVRCFVDIPGQKLPSLSNGDMVHYLKTLVAPQIPEALRKAFLAAVEKGNIKSMPCRSMPATANPTPGVILLGDSLNMRHPSTGGGMSVALSDIVVLRNLLRPLTNLNDPLALCSYLESFYTSRKPAASTVNAMADTLYKAMAMPPDDLAAQLMRKACFDFLRLPDTFTFLSFSLFSCLNPSPYALVLHFSAVALFAVGRELLPYPSPQRILTVIKLLKIASNIVATSLKAEGIREMFFPATIPAYYRKPSPSLTAHDLGHATE